jgi:hypothetical protein
MVSMNYILTMVVRAFWDNEGNKMGATTLSIMTFSIIIKKGDTKHNDTQHNGRVLLR